MEQNQATVCAALPMERNFVWLGAWAFGFSFFFSSSKGRSFTFRTGTLLSSFLFFLSEKVKEIF